MNIEYEQVPNIITGKDLNYLSDMFNWNYGAYKSNINSLNEVTDDEVKELIETATDVFKTSITDILSILASGGTYE